MKIPTETFRPLYERLLQRFKDDAEFPYSFFVQAGQKYATASPRILFVGKAVNGWMTNSSDIDLLFSGHGADNIVNRDDQMTWVKNSWKDKNKDAYNSRRSAFWRVIKRIATHHFPEDGWQDYIAWSNLYKMSPKEGNPTDNQINRQFDLCLEILKEEIRVLSPNVIIFLASGWESAFLPSLGLSEDRFNSEAVSWGKHKTCGQVKDGILYIKTVHPQGKPEHPHAAAVSSVIQKSLVVSPFLRSR